MCIKINRKAQAGFSMAETVMAAGIGTLLVLVLINFTMFSTKSFAALFNYVDLDDVNRIAMDRVTRDVRQANRVKSSTATTLLLEDADGLELSYVYSPYTRLLIRTKAGSPAETILSECDRLVFDVRQRNPVVGSYDVYPVLKSPDSAKVVNVSWSCSRKIMGRIENTESVQTARIVIRKQGT